MTADISPDTEDTDPHPASSPLSRKCIALLCRYNALKFGDFITKSGRTSPYFLDTSSLYHSEAWREFIALCLERAHHHWQPEDLLSIVGPAYKGIPLAISLAEQWGQQAQISIPFSILRKEAKDHGEGGVIMSAHSLTAPEHHHAPQKGVLLMDDVLTSGKSLRQCTHFLRDLKVPIIGALVAIDRQEKDAHNPHLSAKQALTEELQIPIHCVVSIQDLLRHLISSPPSPDSSHSPTPPSALPALDQKHIAKIQSYLHQYGVFYASPSSDSDLEPPPIHGDGVSE